VVCVENSGYPASLELHKIYRVVPDQGAAREGDLRVVDESGEDYLCSADWFAALAVPRRVRDSLLGRQELIPTLCDSGTAAAGLKDEPGPDSEPG